MKKKSWQRSLLFIIASLGLVLTLVGCGNSTKSESKKASSGPTKITFWHSMNGPYKTAINKVIKDFNKSQSKYKVVATPQGNYTTLQQKIMASAKSKDLPVISQTTYTTVPDYTENNLIEPLDPYMIDGKNALTKKDFKDIYPSFLKTSKYQGKYYSIPFSKSVRIMYYNKDILKKYNLKQPESWDDIVADGEVLKKDNIYAMGFDKSWDMEFNGLARQAGNALVAKDGKKLKVNVNTDDSIKAANLIMGMVKDGTAKTAGEDIYWTDAFAQGKSAFYAGSSAGITKMLESWPDGNWGVMPLPSYNGKKATEIAGNDIVMFKGASEKEKEGAWAFMKYLMSTKQTAAWAQATAYVPIRKSAVESDDFQTYLKEKPYNKAAVDSLPAGFQSTAFHGFTEYRTRLLEAVDAMLTKDESVEDALDKLQTQTEKIVKENNN